MSACKKLTLFTRSVESRNYLVNLFLPSYCAANSKVLDSSLKIEENSAVIDFFRDISDCESESNRDFSQISLSESLNQHLCFHKISCKVCEASKSLALADIQNKLKIHKLVQDSGKYNYEGCRIKVNEKINVTFMRSMLRNYSDIQVCDFLEFGFPLGFQGSSQNLQSKDQIWKYKNHKGATEFPKHINSYIEKESQRGAILGPFKSNPFQDNLIVSPLNSVPKKDSMERRIIMDLSFPKGNAINDYIEKNEYLGESTQIVFPKVDDFVELIKAKGKGCLLYKKDLKHAYRQISIEPKDYNLVSFVWNKHIFCDTVLSMGLRSAANICQRVTNAISFIMLQIGIAILNYLDDFAGAEKREDATFAYQCLGSVLQKCGFEESVNKASPPSEIMSFLGVLFNTVTMTMEITPERLIEIRTLVKSWLNKDKASLRQLQSLLGKLNFVAACVKPSRIFISRLLIWLRSIYNSSEFLHDIPDIVRKDLVWWDKFLPIYNGISMMEYENWSKPDSIFSSDSCLTGLGGFWNGCYFHAVFPESIMKQNLHISVLEILAIVICLKLWGKHFKGQRIIVFCDNLSVCQLLNQGNSRSEMLQNSLREICYLAARYEFELRAQHLASSENRISDILSRWYHDEKNEYKFRDLTEGYDLQLFEVSEDMFQFINNW